MEKLFKVGCMSTKFDDDDEMYLVSSEHEDFEYKVEDKSTLKGFWIKPSRLILKQTYDEPIAEEFSYNNNDLATIEDLAQNIRYKNHTVEDKFDRMQNKFLSILEKMKKEEFDNSPYIIDASSVKKGHFNKSLLLQKPYQKTNIGQEVQEIFNDFQTYK